MTTTTDKPLFRVLKGNPDATELAALTAVITSLAGKKPAATDSRERNMWGRPEDRLQRPALYNPNAFRNVTYF
ncbi:acyl-CoA carboxylase subunit epsilon [Corynebacterium halotolerans]|uniref:Acetyl-CoA carboxylase subunit n=1 Tax=Corynebacterium halotolerans YIM 70093 = DSM 44683 TaxID=1121362 RepID=M1NJW2_9CORY|nr:acyl-CoA carboxylase subunit epsilon [Corynebacterium halotolerans]AGF71693.1 hypothetical protein A605_03410 [Corynebacterium halotolerans YIM 70093 = DSM 44683]